MGWFIVADTQMYALVLRLQDILDLMGDRLLDNSSRGAFDGSYKVTGDNKGNLPGIKW